MTQYDDIRQDVALCEHHFIYKNKCVICGITLTKGTADFLKYRYKKVSEK